MNHRSTADTRSRTTFVQLLLPLINGRWRRPADKCTASDDWLVHG
jgi:hypothetical protein